MSNKRIFNLTILFHGFLLCTPTFAQKKTLAGFYISLQGDTVKGIFSSYSEWNRNPSAVEFTATTSVEPIRLTPQNCVKFVVEGYDEYLAYTGQRLINPISDNEVLSTRYINADDEQADIKTFLRLVTRTPNSELYVFRDSKRSNFFYKLPGYPAVELKYKKYYKEDKINQVEEYKNQLNNLFHEEIFSGKLTSSLETLPYTEDKLGMFLEKLFAAGHVKHKQKNPVEGWVISAGASVNFVDVKSDGATTLPKKYNSSISPLLSLGYMIPFNRNFGKFFLYPRLNLFQYKNTGEITDDRFKRLITYQTDLVIAGEVNVGLNILNEQSIRFYLAGGTGMLALLNNNRLEVKYLYLQSSEPYGSSEEINSLKTPPFFSVSTGVVLKNKFLVGASYLFPTSIENSLTYTPKYSGLQFTAGYKL